MLARAATTKTATYQRGKTPFCAPRPAPSMPMTGKAKMPMTKIGQGKQDQGGRTDDWRSR